jgi:hypothetical protein
MATRNTQNEEQPRKRNRAGLAPPQEDAEQNQAEDQRTGSRSAQQNVPTGAADEVEDDDAESDDTDTEEDEEDEEDGSGGHI